MQMHTIIMFTFLDLTSWKGPDSTGALTASTLWPMSSFPKSWSLSTPTSLSTLEKTHVFPWVKYPSIWKRLLFTNVAPARPNPQPNRRRGKRAKGLRRQIWLLSSRGVKRQNLPISHQINQHRRRRVWWNRMMGTIKGLHHICSIKWLPPLLGDKR